MKQGKPTKPNRTGKSTAADSVQTPDWLAERIVKHYRPTGKSLEPCRGDGAFYKYLPDPKTWCEISQGRDFFDYNKEVNWIITNPPYSIYNRFLEHCFELADNVVFLCPIAKAFKSLSTERLIRNYGGLKEIWLIGSGTTCGFAFGFPTGCLHYQRNYSGKITYIYDQ